MEIGETEGESFMKLVWNWLGWDGHVRGMGERLGKGGCLQNRRYTVFVPLSVQYA